MPGHMWRGMSKPSFMNDGNNCFPGLHVFLTCRSSDMSGIWFVRRLVCHGPPTTTVDALWTCIQTEWREIPQEHIHVLFDSMPRRLGALTAAISLQMWFACSPPNKANRVQYAARSLPDICMWELCQAMPLVSGFSRRSPPKPIHSGAAPYSPQSPSPALKISLTQQMFRTVYSAFDACSAALQHVAEHIIEDGRRVLDSFECCTNPGLKLFSSVVFTRVSYTSVCTWAQRSRLHGHRGQKACLRIHNSSSRYGSTLSKPKYSFATEENMQLKVKDQGQMSRVSGQQLLASKKVGSNTLDKQPTNMAAFEIIDKRKIQHADVTGIKANGQRSRPTSYGSKMADGEVTKWRPVGSSSGARCCCPRLLIFLLLAMFARLEEPWWCVTQDTILHCMMVFLVVSLSVQLREEALVHTCRLELLQTLDPGIKIPSSSCRSGTIRCCSLWFWKKGGGGVYGALSFYSWVAVGRLRRKMALARGRGQSRQVRIMVLARGRGQSRKIRIMVLACGRGQSRKVRIMVLACGRGQSRKVRIMVLARGRGQSHKVRIMVLAHGRGQSHQVRIMVLACGRGQSRKVRIMVLARGRGQSRQVRIMVLACGRGSRQVRIMVLAHGRGQSSQIRIMVLARGRGQSRQVRIMVLACGRGQSRKVRIMVLAHCRGQSHQVRIMVLARGRGQSRQVRIMVLACGRGQSRKVRIMVLARGRGQSRQVRIMVLACGRGQSCKVRIMVLARGRGQSRQIRIMVLACGRGQSRKVRIMVLACGRGQSRQVRIMVLAHGRGQSSQIRIMVLAHGRGQSREVRIMVLACGRGQSRQVRIMVLARGRG
ncbi:hypothetical protein PR048_029813 [Dryococelus australis]|uniref:Uncharacterized protein n=1 Tax=Dryococelus australis TaxID=614101 RepID=A0ABQ9G779_9NEOP|nr:hypothetical protein PR048_029813 [Dryococelus australis]